MLLSYGLLATWNGFSSAFGTGFTKVSTTGSIWTLFIAVATTAVTALGMAELSLHILSQEPSTTGPLLFGTRSGHLSLLICRMFFLFHDRMHSLINMVTPASSTNGRRTNSLGSARPDCHTCSALHRKCDRQRPRCRTCQDTGVVCKGFSMQLSWQRGLSVQNLPSKVASGGSRVSTPRNPNPASPSTSSSANRAKGLHRHLFLLKIPASSNSCRAGLLSVGARVVFLLKVIGKVLRVERASREDIRLQCLRQARG
jgi:hypothetical protein